MTKVRRRALGSGISLALASLLLMGGTGSGDLVESTDASRSSTTEADASLESGTFAIDAVGSISTGTPSSSVPMAVDHIAAGNRIELDDGLSNHFAVRTVSTVGIGRVSGDELSLSYDTNNLLADDFQWWAYAGSSSCSAGNGQGGTLLASGTSLDAHRSSGNSFDFGETFSTASTLCLAVKAKNGSEIWPNQSIDVSLEVDARAVNNDNGTTSWSDSVSATSQMMTWGGGGIDMYWLAGDNEMRPDGNHHMNTSGENSTNRGGSQMRSRDEFIYRSPTNADGRFLHTETQTRGFRVSEDSPNALWDLSWMYWWNEGDTRLSDHLVVHVVENPTNIPCQEWIPQDSQEARDVIDNRTDLHIARLSSIQSALQTEVERIRPSRVYPGEQLLMCLVYEFSDPNGDLDDLEGEEYFVSPVNHYISGAHNEIAFNG